MTIGRFFRSSYRIFSSTLHCKSSSHIHGPFVTTNSPHLALRFYTSTNQESKDAASTTDEKKPEPEKASADTPDDSGATDDTLKELSREELLVEYSKLKAALAEAETEAKAMKNKLAYALADIDNVRKISRKDVANAREFALKDFGKDLLDVVDNCERALTMFPPECREKGHPMAGIYTGLEMTASVMLKVFDRHGLARIEIKPKETLFDPNFHDALFQQPVEGIPAGTVFSLVKSGWTINGRVLRAAQVGVSSDPPEPEEEAKA